MQIEQEPSTHARPTWLSESERAARRLAAASLAGALSGLLIGGIGGRLFMALLAGMNREDHGVITSDGFPMGEVTLSGTLNLMLVGATIGLLGGGFYLVLRDLRTGPHWFDTTCVAVGATVVVGAVMVHSDGPDFTLLEPIWAAIALTLAVPCSYALAMPPLAERWLRDDSALMKGTSRWPFLALLPWIFPLFFVTPLLVAGWWTRRRLTSHPAAWATRLRRAVPWIGRAALMVLFVGAAVDLVTEIQEIRDITAGPRFP